jgi:hypothetical protein
MRDQSSLSAIVIARDEEEFIPGCLRSLSWADEVVVVDTGSRDATVKVAREAGARLVKANPEGTFADWRNLGREEASGDWLFYVDADERVTPELREEVERLTGRERKTGQAGVFFVRRENIFLGRRMREDRVERLFRKSALEGWEGALSEHPRYRGRAGELGGRLLHLSHRDLTSMLEKTRLWSRIEAGLLRQAGHPPMAGWRFLRVILAESWRRLGRETYWRYGAAGTIEALFQTLSVFVTYARLWELQGGRLGGEGRGEWRG